MEQKKTQVEIYKNENPVEALIKVMEYYGDEVPASSSKNVRCPFHNDNNPSFNIDRKKGLFKCFSECGAHGDAFEYIKLKEGVGFQEALQKAGEIFGIKEERNKKAKSKTELLDDFIKNNIKEFAGDTKYKYEEHYVYKDASGKAVLIKIKFRDPETRKKTFITKNLIDEGTHYRMAKKDEEGVDEAVNLFYNSNLIAEAIRNKDKIYIVEGEKDANTLVKLGFIAISCRNTKSLTNEMINSLNGADIVVIPDMDAVGSDHEKVLTEKLLGGASHFRVLKLNELKKLNKKDVTDFVEVLESRSFSKEYIQQVIEEYTFKTLDLKNTFTLQQDRRGIKRFKFEKDKETGDVTITPVYITNFRIKEARLCINEDDATEEIEIVTEMYKYAFSKKPIIKIIRGEVREIFADTKAFSSQLGMSMSLYGGAKDLIDLREWIDKYFLVDEKYEYQQVGIREDIYIDGEPVKCLMTHSGALMPNGELNTEIKSVTEYANIDLEGRGIITKEDANKLLEHMFRFTTSKNAMNIWGCLVAGMLNPYYKGSTQNPSILHICGASGTGKSYALENVVMPILNTDYVLSFEGTTNHALKLASDATNLVVLMDEVKPSKAKAGRMDALSGFARELTGVTRTVKGSKDQSAREYKFNSGLIIVGEETIEETAVKNRSNVVMYSDSTTTEEHVEHGSELMKREYQELMKDLGFTLYLEILNNWSSERIDETKDLILKKYPIDAIKLRERGTYVNTVMGLMILEEVLNRVTGRDLVIVKNAISLVKENLFENVLDGAEGAKQNYEQWLELLETLSVTSDERFKLEVGTHFKKILENDEECIAIAFSDAYMKTYEYSNKMGNKLEGDRVLKKLLKLSKYSAVKNKKKNVRFNISLTETKAVDAVVLKVSELEKLEMNNIIETARKAF